MVFDSKIIFDKKESLNSTWKIIVDFLASRGFHPNNIEYILSKVVKITKLLFQKNGIFT